MPYEVQIPALTVLEKVGEIIAADGSTVGLEHISVMYGEKDIIPDEKLSPVVIKLYNDGDAHTRKVLKRVAKSKAVKAEEPEEAEES